MVIVSVVFIFIVKFGARCGLKRSTTGQKLDISFNRSDARLLTLLLFRVSSMCLCQGTILLGDTSAFHNDSTSSSSSVLANSAGEDTKHDLTVPSKTNLWTMAAAASANSGENSDSLYIIRNNLGDTFFDVDQSWFSCSLDKCARRSSGTATIALELNNIADGRKLFFDRYGSPNEKLCYCRCLQNTPIFREDLHVCVNDVHECGLVSFVSGNIQQKIPYVFLPLRGQIIYPNAEIKFNGINSVPTCIISRVRYLGRSGWSDIKNYTIAEYNHESSTPFRLFHDKRRTFLQWLGNADLRSGMEGRLILIDLICKDMDSQLIFTPCISFRVAGIPGSGNFFPSDMNDGNANFTKEKKFSSNEYVALGLATLLIALIYIASVFLYLNFKKNKIKEKSSRRNNAFKQFVDVEDSGSHLFSDGCGQSKQLIVEEEGLIKNNPLLMKRYHSPTSANKSPLTSGENCTFSSLHNVGINSNSADKIEVYSPTAANRVPMPERSRVVSNVGHANKPFEGMEQRWSLFRNRLTTPFDGRSEPKGQQQTLPCPKQSQAETNNIEEKHPDENISIVECPEDVVQANSKHKLYFNPAYLEPELLLAPPPAAVEFLMKIREIMTIAKRKISTKKFLPSLTEIQEENQNNDDLAENYSTCGNRQKPEIVEPTAEICEKATATNPAYQYKEKEKRQIIQKWLQSIPTSQSNDRTCVVVQERQVSGIAEESRCSTLSRNYCDFENEKTTVSSGNQDQKGHELAQLVEEQSTANPTTVPVKPIKVPEIVFASLEKKKTRKRMEEQDSPCESTEKSEPLLSLGTISNGGFNSSLPLDEELTMQNTIYNIVTGNTTLSKMKVRYETDPEYCRRSLEDKYRLSEEHAEGRYSLVSEVYVNDGFSSSGSDSSLSSSSNSLPERVVSLDEGTQRNESHESSRLMIQLKDCPFFYSIENTDDFEPDTLDRKPSKDEGEYPFGPCGKFIDSLERPAICLRTRGSFKNDLTPSLRTSSLKRSFGSLQEIYQQRRKSEWDGRQPAHPMRDDGNVNGDAPCSLTPQIESFLWRKERFSLRHHHRQRKSSPPPPIPREDDTMHFTPKRAKPPLPPRKSDLQASTTCAKPSEPPCFKVQNFRRSSLGNKDVKAFPNSNMWWYRPDDSGYLSSSDSEKGPPFVRANKSPYIETHNHDVSSINALQTTADFCNTSIDNNDDDDDDDDSTSSFNDGNSESGAESTATNFKFYKNRGRIINEV